MGILRPYLIGHRVSLYDIPKTLVADEEFAGNEMLNAVITKAEAAE